MHEFDVLWELVVIFVIGVAVATLLRRVHVPPIAGFIVAGVLIGPRAIGVVPDLHQVELLAEVGVVLLLFGIGLELSLDRVKRLWRPIMLGGTLQVGLTALSTLGLGLIFGLEWRIALFLGLLASVSSTAIVLRGMESRGEVDAPHGRLTLGILIFQDLCVVPMMLALPFLAGTAGSTWAVLAALARAAGVLLGVLVAARLIVPRVLGYIAQTRQRDLFVLAVLVVCLGAAWAVSLVGISLSLGAFIGGLVVAGSQFRHQAMADLIPFREVFASLFFISVGMLLDPMALLANPGPVLFILAAILLGKFALVFLTAVIMRLPLRVCVLSGMALAQVGEFSFVLSRAAQGTPLVEDSASGYLISAAILSMLLTPLALAVAPHMATGMGRFRALTRVLGVTTLKEDTEARGSIEGHVIIAGYGIAGEELARALRESGIPYVVVDLNPENVQRAERDGTRACYCDVTSPEILEHIGASHARELILVINDPDALMRAIKAARLLAPQLPILVRTRYLGDVKRLLEAGATRVVTEEVEAAAEITADVLSRHGVEREIIDERLRVIRERLAEELAS